MNTLRNLAVAQSKVAVVSLHTTSRMDANLFAKMLISCCWKAACDASTRYILRSNHCLECTFENRLQEHSGHDCESNDQFHHNKAVRTSSICFVISSITTSNSLSISPYFATAISCPGSVSTDMPFTLTASKTCCSRSRIV